VYQIEDQALSHQRFLSKDQVGSHFGSHPHSHPEGQDLNRLGNQVKFLQVNQVSHHGDHQAHSLLGSRLVNLVVNPVVNHPRSLPVYPFLNHLNNRLEFRQVNLPSNLYEHHQDNLVVSLQINQLFSRGATLPFNPLLNLIDNPLLSRKSFLAFNQLRNLPRHRQFNQLSFHQSNRLGDLLFSPQCSHKGISRLIVPLHNLLFCQPDSPLNDQVAHRLSNHQHNRPSSHQVNLQSRPLNLPSNQFVYHRNSHLDNLAEGPLHNRP
jgi:hypothetical protein